MPDVIYVDWICRLNRYLKKRKTMEDNNLNEIKARGRLKPKYALYEKVYISIIGNPFSNDRFHGFKQTFVTGMCIVNDDIYYALDCVSDNFPEGDLFKDKESVIKQMLSDAKEDYEKNVERIKSL
jgi:hypothetical protein